MKKFIFQKRHYKFFAKIFGKNLKEYEENESRTENIIEDLIFAFSKENPNFKEDVFRKSMRKSYKKSSTTFKI